MKGQVAFDTVMHEGDNGTAEGCYRLDASHPWKVFFLSNIHRDDNLQITDIQEPEVYIDAVWASGITGVNAKLPARIPVNKETVKNVLSSALKTGVEWEEVQGPDSLSLK